MVYSNLPILMISSAVTSKLQAKECVEAAMAFAVMRNGANIIFVGNGQQHLQDTDDSAISSWQAAPLYDAQLYSLGFNSPETQPLDHSAFATLCSQATEDVVSL